MAARKSTSKARGTKPSKGKTKIKDLDVKNRAHQVHGGTPTKPGSGATKAIEITDYGFGVSMPVSTSK